MYESNENGCRFFSNISHSVEVDHDVLCSSPIEESMNFKLLILNYKPYKNYIKINRWEHYWTSEHKIKKW